MATGRKDDAGKLRWGLLRKSLVLPLEAVIRVLMYGADKYGNDNWQGVDNPLVRYRDALDRHLADIDKGVIVDPDTGENNYAHVATNALFLLWFYLAGDKAVQAPRACTCHPDDRPDGPCRERYAASECQALAARQRGDAVEYEYEVWQGGALQAGGREADYAAAPTAQPAASAEPSDEEWLQRLGTLLGEYGEAISFDEPADVERAANAVYAHARALLSRYGRPAGDAQPMPAAIKATIKEALIFRHDAGEDQDACDNALNWLSQHSEPVAAQKADEVECSCVDIYPADSYGAGFIDALGHFPNCEAAASCDDSQKADDARDAERWREVERRATKKTAYDRYGNGAYWSVGVFSDDSRQTFGETIDAAIAQQRKGE